MTERTPPGVCEAMKVRRRWSASAGSTVGELVKCENPKVTEYDGELLCAVHRRQRERWALDSGESPPS